ncbi:aldehyde dehydrogenase family protein [Streptomyces sp. CBMA29]|uniref:aldehyde dehydrogenase family protein n=1 Tax=Streptomyces sp. CBMA29 TaxID=1896314 RepID=UPI001661D4EF|nr:aldehyde dehydrogenase family protein [Streptomyces sp. CBMA29]MBD0738866.1 benzaldehyde dehydrogenase [Streptomyces sp. CBMA29]
MPTPSTPRAWDGALFVGGAFVPAENGRTSTVLDKARQEPLGRAGWASPADLDRAAREAAVAGRAWAAADFGVRADVLREAAARLRARAGEFADLIVRETGSIRGKAEYEIAGAVEELHQAAALAGHIRAETLPTRAPGRESVAQRVPLGVVGVITPWNFPLVLAMRVLAPALAVGNAVVLKPSPHTPLSGGLLIADVFAEAGLPAGVLQVVPGGQDSGEALTAHPDIAMVHFTGSSAVGRTIAREAGERLKKVSLELGGNNALIVLDDADLDQAGQIGAWSAFHYQGQTCITAGRHIVQRPVFDAYVADLAARAARITVGDPARDGVGLGPMISAEQRERARKLLAEAVAEGATVVEGGDGDGLFHRPTVVTGVTRDMALWTEEIFAPIAPVLAVDTDAEALAVANDTPYGLVDAVLTSDLARGRRLAAGLGSAMVHINDSTCLDEPQAPFGGLAASGLGGRSGGESNLHEFTQLRWFTVQSTPVHYPY